VGTAIVSLTVKMVVRGGDAAAHHHDSRNAPRTGASGAQRISARRGDTPRQ